MDGFADDKHLPDEFEDLWFVPFPDLHPVLHGHNDILSAVFSTMLGALLRSAWMLNRNVLDVTPNSTRCLNTTCSGTYAADSQHSAALGTSRGT